MRKMILNKLILYKIDIISLIRLIILKSLKYFIKQIINIKKL